MDMKMNQWRKGREEGSPDWMDTLTSLTKIRSCKVDNENILKVQESQAEVNATILHILSNLLR